VLGTFVCPHPATTVLQVLNEFTGVKLYQEGYNGNWAVDKIIATHGQHSIKIPNIAAGQYLLRPELISE
jgi:Auxiliary Activity family 9 (formerly GH61)